MSYRIPSDINDSVHNDSDTVDDEYTMPCAQAMVAGTLALMTGHARCGCAQHRDMMGSKAAYNLGQLAQHPAMSEGFREVAFKLHMQWVELVQAERIRQHPSDHLPAQAPLRPAADRTHLSTAEMSRAEMARAEMSRALWHTTPEVIQ